MTSFLRRLSGIIGRIGQACTSVARSVDRQVCSHDAHISDFIFVRVILLDVKPLMCLYLSDTSPVIRADKLVDTKSTFTFWSKIVVCWSIEFDWLTYSSARRSKMWLYVDVFPLVKQMSSTRRGNNLYCILCVEWDVNLHSLTQ